MDLQKFKKYKLISYAGVTLLIIIFLSLFISLLISIDNQTFYMALALTALPLCVIALALILTGAILTNKYRALEVNGVYKNAAKYAPLPYHKIVDYKTELETVRENYAADLSEDKNAVNVEKINKGLVYKKLKAQARDFLDLSVLKSGKIYFGYVVNCFNFIDTLAKNTNKFGIIKVLYSTDEYYEANPNDLKEICKRLYSLESDKIDSAKLITEPFTSNYKLPKELCGGREVYLTSVFAERVQLPTGYISNNILPIIASPQNSASAFAVDCKYWSDAFVGNFAYRHDAVKYAEYNKKRISAFSQKSCGDYAKELDDMRAKFTADEINAPVDLLGDNPFPSFEFANIKLHYACILDCGDKKREGEPYTGIYGEDEYFKANPNELKIIAEKLKNDENELKNIKNVVNYKAHAIQTLTLPLGLTDGRTVNLTAVFVEKDNLPLRRFDDNVIPVISFGGEEGDWIYSVDSKYWGDGFTYEYINAGK